MAECFSFNKKQWEEIRSNAPEVPDAAIPKIENKITAYLNKKKQGESEPLNKNQMVARLSKVVSSTDNLLNEIKDVIPTLNLFHQAVFVQAKDEGHAFADKLNMGMNYIIQTAVYGLPELQNLCIKAKEHIEAFSPLYKKTKFNEGIRIRLAYDIRCVLQAHGIQCTSSPGRPFVRMLRICLGAVNDNLADDGRALQDIAIGAKHYSEWIDRRLKKQLNKPSINVVK